jgi:hypothetical protein
MRDTGAEQHVRGKVAQLRDKTRKSLRRKVLRNLEADCEVECVVDADVVDQVTRVEREAVIGPRLGPGSVDSDDCVDA